VRLWLAQARREIDFRIAELARGTKLTCSGPGCAGCCQGEVPLQPEEMEPILPLVTEAQLRRAATQARDLEDARAGTEGDGLSARMLRGKFRRFLAHQLCPLLDTETLTCTVYAERPLVCRGMVVTSPVERCDNCESVEIPLASQAAIGAVQKMRPGGSKDPVLLRHVLAGVAAERGIEPEPRKPSVGAMYV
jgi:Fe-S-cluster containining protein